MQVNRDKSSVKGYKTLLLRVKQLKSKSNTYKQNQIKCKRIKNTIIKNKSKIEADSKESAKGKGNYGVLATRKPLSVPRSSGPS